MLSETITIRNAFDLAKAADPMPLLATFQCNIMHMETASCRAISQLIFGNQDHHLEMRMRIDLVAVQNKDHY